MFALTMSVLMSGAGALAGPTLAASDVHFSPLPFLNFANDMFGDQSVLGAVEALTGSHSQVSPGADGRFTVLLVGSDRRADSTNGERLDTIMVMSLNPNNNELAAVSIPRDIARVPLAPQFGGGTFHSKINGMFKWFKKNNGGSRSIALEKFRQEVAWLLDTSIDYVGYTRFDGFDRLVDEADGVFVNSSAEIHDPSYIDKPTWPTGARFLAQNNMLLEGASAARCYGGYPKPVTNWNTVTPCYRALVYVRSRHGKVGATGNNDYRRARRQQTFVFDAIRRVRTSLSRAQNVRTAAISIPNDFYTTIPISTPADGLQLYNLLQGTTLVNQAVFSPSTYAGKVPGTSAIALKLTAVRSLCHSWFAPVAH